MLKDKVLEYWEQEHPDKLLDLIERGHADVVSMTYLYIDSFKEDPQAIYKHIDEIAGALEQSDFIEYCEGNTKTRLEMIEGIKEAPENSFLFMFPETEPTDPAEQEAEGALSLEELRDLTRVHIPTAERRDILINDLTSELARYEQNYENCYRFFGLCLSRQLDVIDKYLDGDRREYTRIVDSYITKWYRKPIVKPSYVPMAHGTPTDEFRFMTSKGAELDRAKNLTVRRGNVTLKVSDFGNIGVALGVGVDKLLSSALMEFTRSNDFRTARPDNINRDVRIDFNEYARALGYDIDVRETSTPEEEAKEKKRVKSVRDNALKAVRKDLAILRACDISWTEYTNGKHIKAPQFFDQPIIGRRGYIDGDILITFDADFANYMVNRNFITYYPVELLKLDARKPNAYYIGRKLSSHYYMKNNRAKGTYNRLQVQTILEVTELPSYEDLKEKGIARKWEERIKDRLEEALEELYRIGVLRSWTYCHQKGIELTDVEKGDIISYAEFKDLYIKFDLKDALLPEPDNN